MVSLFEERNPPSLKATARRRVGDVFMAKKKATRRASNSSTEIVVSKKEAMMYSQLLMGGAVVAVVLAGLGYLGTDIWLASTQWLLVAAVLALFGIYTKMMK